MLTDSVRAVIKKMNKELGVDGKILLGSEVVDNDKYRLPTGVLTTDVITGGGIPMSGITEIFGAESSCKTAVALSTAACTQSSGGLVVFGSAEGFGKNWARRNGLFIPVNEEEKEEVVELVEAYETTVAFLLSLKFHAVRDSLTEEESYDWGTTIEFVEDLLNHDDPKGIMSALEEVGSVLKGSLLVVYHTHGDGLLRSLLDLMKTGEVDLVVIDSISVLKPQRLTDKAEIGDAEIGAHAFMTGQFVDRCYPIWNMGNAVGVIAINQVAAAWQLQKVTGDVKPRSGSKSLKHGKILSLFAKQGEVYDERLKDGTQNVYGIGSSLTRVKWKISVPRIRKGPIKFFTADGRFEHRRTYAGMVDRSFDVFFWARYAGMIEQRGAWYELIAGEFAGERWQGEARVLAALDDSPELKYDLEAQVLEWVEKSKLTNYRVEDEE